MNTEQASKNIFMYKDYLYVEKSLTISSMTVII